MNCHAADSAFRFSIEGAEILALPWREEDFDECQLGQPLVSLRSGETSGGLFSELVRALSLWYLQQSARFIMR